MDRIVQSFDEIGLALRGSYNVDQLQRFYDGISRFISSTEIEQEHQLSGNLPTFQEYMGNRLGTSAVDITNASVEYGLSLHLPSDIMRSESTRTLWRETNLIFSITNDLMSHKKEFETGSVENMLPLAFASTYDIGTAISKLVDSLRASKDRFDQEAKVLTQEAKQHGCCSEVEQYIQVLRSNCVGNLIWR
jgi:hypothetical protein